jgi:flagella basal body P-ring formation protein FlgA
MRRFPILCSALAVGAFALAAAAEPLLTVDTARVQLKDVAEVSNGELGDVDLGPAPPPGGSRLFVREDLLRDLQSQGIDPRSVKVPARVRVASAARRFAPNELAEMVRQPLVAALPPAVKLEQLTVARGVLASPRISVGEVRVPKLPRRAGSTTVTAMVDLMHDDQVATRLPLTLKLEVSEQAAAALVTRGARVELVIARGAAKISASAVALEDAELGQIASFKVSSTQKVLRARVQSRGEAMVVTP